MFLSMLTIIFMGNLSLKIYPQIFCDTSFFYSMLDITDRYYAEVKKWVQEIKESNITLITTWDVISETLTLFITRKKYSLSLLFLEEVDPIIKKIEYSNTLREEAIKTFKKFNKDAIFSFCDCLSYQVIRDLLDDIPALSFDDDFKKMGLTVLC